MSGCLFLCAFHVLSPFALDMSSCRGKTYCKSFTVLRVFELWEAGFYKETASLTFPQFGLPFWRGWQCDIWGVTDYHERLTYSTIPLLRLFLVPSVLYPCEVCVNQISVWAKIPIPLFTLNLAPIALPPPLNPSPLQSASQSRCSSPVHLQQGAGSQLQLVALSVWPHHAVSDTTTHEVHL